MKRIIAMLCTLIIVFTIGTTPAYAATFKLLATPCPSCGEYAYGIVGTYAEETAYIRFDPGCDAVQTTVHDHVIVTYYNDCVCYSCGYYQLEYVRQKEFCPFTNMSKAENIVSKY